MSPIKHQQASFRNRGGRHYTCWCDAPDREEAILQVTRLRAEGKRAFYETQDGGAYVRVYVEAPSLEGT